MRVLVALGLAVVLLGVPAPGLPVADAAVPEAPEAPDTTLAASAIVPGVANRSSVNLQATYDASLKLNWSTRKIRVIATLAVTNTSGSAIDRVELNTIAARLGGMRLDPVTVDGLPVKATVDDQTIVVPLGGILPAGATTSVRVAYRATLRRSLTGSSWLFTKANGIVDLYRWLPWISRATPFTRPNHGDPFVTPTSPFVRVKVVTNRKLVLATSGNRVSKSADGRTQVFEVRNVRDFTVTAAADYKTRSRTVGDNIVRVYYRPGAPAAAMLDAAADAFKAIEKRLGPYPRHTFKVVQSAGRFGMESPGLIWIPTGAPRANLRYLAAHETAHQWFYSLVGNDQAREPFVDEAAADFVARFVTHTKRSSRCSAARLDRTIYKYSSACYYERIYIRGGNLLDAARKAMGSTAFWKAMRGYVAANRFGLVKTATLLDALDDATPKDLGATLFAKRFPRLY